MHLELEELERHLDGELDHARAREVAVHLAGCADCRAQARELRRESEEVEALLGTLDSPPARRARSRAGLRMRWAAAAAVLLALAGAAYALTSTPLGTWVGERLTHRTTQPRHEAPAQTPQAPLAGEASVSGVAIEPGARLTIQFEARRSEQQVHVRLDSGEEVMVRGPASLASYSSGAGRLSIDNRPGDAVFEISIPRTAPEVSIAVGETTRLLARAGVIECAVSPDASGTYVIPLAP